MFPAGEVSIGLEFDFGVAVGEAIGADEAGAADVGAGFAFAEDDGFAGVLNLFERTGPDDFDLGARKPSFSTGIFGVFQGFVEGVGELVIVIMSVESEGEHPLFHGVEAEDALGFLDFDGFGGRLDGVVLNGVRRGEPFGGGGQVEHLLTQRVEFAAELEQFGVFGA